MKQSLQQPIKTGLDLNTNIGKHPYIIFKLHQAQNVFLNPFNNQNQLCDTYALIQFGFEQISKTKVQEQTSNPVWNHQCELLFSENNEDHNIIVSIYDNDQFGTDDLLAKQKIPIDYFLEEDRVGKEFKFWILMSYSDSDSSQNQLFDFQNDKMDLKSFENQILNLEENQVDQINQKGIIMQISVKAINYKELRKIQAKIYDIDEEKVNNFLEKTVFYYVFLISRNDGKEWMIKKRYNEIIQFIQMLRKKHSYLRNIEFKKQRFFQTMELNFQQKQ